MKKKLTRYCLYLQLNCKLGQIKALIFTRTLINYKKDSNLDAVGRYFGFLVPVFESIPAVQQSIVAMVGFVGVLKISVFVVQRRSALTGSLKIESD